MIRRRVFTSRVAAAALAGTACRWRGAATAPPRTDALWYDPSPDAARRMRPGVAMERAVAALRHERTANAVPAPSLLAVTWSTPIDGRPTSLIAGRRGLVAADDTQCVLVDRQGQRRGALSCRHGGMMLDAGGDHLVAVRTEDETPAVFAVPSGKARGAWPWPPRESLQTMRRWGDLYLITSVVRPALRSGAEPVAGALLTRMPSVVSHRGRPPAGRRPVGFIRCPASPAVLDAASPHGLVFATARGLQWTNWALQPGVDWRRRTKPIALAMDDDGAAVLVARVNGTLRLLVVDAAGKGELDIALADTVRAMGSPMLGPQGRIVLAPPGELIAYDRDGRIAWHVARDGRSDPVSLGDHGILVEHARQLWWTDWAGRARPIANLPGPLTASPCRWQNTWYVACEGSLHRMDPAG